jgi:hypothetical protein
MPGLLLCAVLCPGRHAAFLPSDFFSGIIMLSSSSRLLSRQRRRPCNLCLLRTAGRLREMAQWAMMGAINFLSAKNTRLVYKAQFGASLSI